MADVFRPLPPAPWHVEWSLPLNPRYERWRWQTFGITWLIYASLLSHAAVVQRREGGAGRRPAFTLAREQLGLDRRHVSDGLLARPVLLRPAGRSLRAATDSAVRHGAERAGGGRIRVLDDACRVLRICRAAGHRPIDGLEHTSKAMSSWFSLRERGRVLGWWCTHYTAGAAVATPFAGWLMEHLGHVVPTGSAGYGVVPFWPAAFWGPAAVLCGRHGAHVAAAAQPAGRCRPAADRAVSRRARIADRAKRTRSTAGRRRFVAADRRSAVDAQRLDAGDCVLSGQVVALLVLFLGAECMWKKAWARRAFTSAITAAWMPIGGMVGVIASGYISDKLFQARRAPVIVLSLLATAGVMLLGLTHIDNIWMMRAYLLSGRRVSVRARFDDFRDGGDRLRHEARRRHRDRVRQRRWLDRRDPRRILAGHDDRRNRLDAVFVDFIWRASWFRR